MYECKVFTGDPASLRNVFHIIWFALLKVSTQHNMYYDLS